MPSTLEDNTRPWICDMLAAGAFVVLLVTDYFVSRGTNRVLHILGTVALLLSPVFMFAPFYLLKKHGTVGEGIKFFETTRVVDRGVYAIVRHPQYLGYILLVLGFTLHSQHYLTAIIGAASIALFYVQSIREERFCARQLGADYVAYMKRVPQFNVLAGSVRHLMSKRQSKEGCQFRLDPEAGTADDAPNDIRPTEFTDETQTYTRSTPQSESARKESEADATDGG